MFNESAAGESPEKQEFFEKLGTVLKTHTADISELEQKMGMTFEEISLKAQPKYLINRLDSNPEKVQFLRRPNPKKLRSPLSKTGL